MDDKTGAERLKDSNGRILSIHHKCFVGPVGIRVNHTLKQPRLVCLATVVPKYFEPVVPDSKLNPPCEKQQLNDIQKVTSSDAKTGGKRIVRLILAWYHVLHTYMHNNWQRLKRLIKEKKKILRHLRSIKESDQAGLIQRYQPDAYATILKMPVWAQNKIWKCLQAQLLFFKYQFEANIEWIQAAANLRGDPAAISKFNHRWQIDFTRKDPFLYRVAGNYRFYTYNWVCEHFYLSDIKYNEKKLMADKSYQDR